MQRFMQDENVVCRDLGKESFERAVGCFGTFQLERATCLSNVSIRELLDVLKQRVSCSV